MTKLRTILLAGAIIYCVLALLQVCLFPPGSLGILDNLLFPIGFVYMVMRAWEDRRIRRIVVMFLLLFTWSVISQLLNHSGDLVDHLPYHFLFLKWPVILVVGIECVTNQHIARYTDIFINGLFLTLVAINLFLLLNPYGLGEQLQHIYSSSNYSDFIYYNEPGTFRLAGTQMNPNDNAVLWACFLIVYLFKANLTKYWTYGLLAGGMLFFTQSRTVFLLVCIVSIFYILNKAVRAYTWKRMLVSLALMLVTGVGIVLSSTYLRSLFSGAAFTSHSFLFRLNNYGKLGDKSIGQLATGSGVIDNPIESIGYYIDSEYLGIILQFGLVGLVLWLGVVVLILRGSFRKQTLFLLFIMLGTSFTNFSFLHLQLGVIFSFFLGMSFAADNREIIRPTNIPRRG